VSPKRSVTALPSRGALPFSETSVHSLFESAFFTVGGEAGCAVVHAASINANTNVNPPKIVRWIFIVFSFRTCYIANTAIKNTNRIKAFANTCKAIVFDKLKQGHPWE